MMLRVNRVHFPVTVLGHGRRIGIWTQGCSIGCPGCVSPQTWDRDPARLKPIDAILAWCAACADVDGVTISGGEPFEQPEALAELLDGLDRWRQTHDRPIDLLCYSGLPRRRIERDHAALLARLDAFIPEPYVATRPTAMRWRGSANQPVVPLSALGRARYGEGTDQPPEGPHLQAAMHGDLLWMIGVPTPGELDRIHQNCADAGVRLETQ